MTNDDKTLWAGVRGALGKAAADRLQHNSLSDIVRAKIASEGSFTAEHVTMGDAAAALTRHAVERKKEAALVVEGYAAADALGLTNERGEMESPSGLFPKVAHAYKIERLKGLASEGLRGELDDLFDKTAGEIYDELYKAAGMVDMLSKAVKGSKGLVDGAADYAGDAASRNVNKVIDQAGDSAMRTGAKLGLGVAGGAAVPTYLVGTKMREDATADMQEKALQTAAGVGALGLGAYGLSRMLPGGEKNSSSQTLEDEFLATVYVDEKLAGYNQTEKIASLRRRNRRRGVEILFNTLRP